jgi:hypothetical protein
LACVSCGGDGIVIIFGLYTIYSGEFFEAIRLSPTYYSLRPGFLNSLAGVVSTLTTVYGRDHGFKPISKLTLIIIGGTNVVCAALILFYKQWMLRRAIEKHEREFGEVVTGKHGEGVQISRRWP